MVIGIHRVMLLCVTVILTNIVFVRPTIATDARVKDLAAKAGVRILRDSSSDKSLQRQSAGQVPLQRMSQRSQQRAQFLLDNTSQYRRMPTLQYEVDASLYQYLINHPDVAIATWRVMGISKLNMWQTAPFEYKAEATDGSKGRADVLWRDANQCLFVVEGAYHSPLLPSAIEASALVWLRYRFERTSDNRVVVNQQIETFINFPSAAIETIAKLASMVTNSILDRNVMEVSLYAQMMSRAVQRDPRWVEEVADRMESVPDQRKAELCRVARGQNPYQDEGLANVASRAGQSQASQPPGLSHSKQQLLQSVRSGKGVMIVRPGPKADSVLVVRNSAGGEKRPSEQPSVGTSLGDALRRAQAVAAAAAESVATMASKPSAAPKPDSDVQEEANARQVAGTQRLTTRPDSAHAKQADEFSQAGYLKDGRSVVAVLAGVQTGPAEKAVDGFSEAKKSPSESGADDGQLMIGDETSMRRGGALETEVSHHRESESPALVALPPVSESD